MLSPQSSKTGIGETLGVVHLEAKFFSISGQTGYLFLKYNKGTNIVYTFLFQNREHGKNQGIIGHKQVQILGGKISLGFKAWEYSSEV